MKKIPFMRRAVIVVAVMIVVVGAVLAASVQPTQALEAHISKVKSDCVSLEMGVTLFWRMSDNDNDEDVFRVFIYEREAFADTTAITIFDERIVEEQSPFYWKTHRISAPTYRGRYTIEIWDVNDVGDPWTLLDQVHYECSTGISWRGGDDIEGAGSIHTLEPPDGLNVKEPPFGCGVEMPIFTTNQAPEDGAIILTWSGGLDRNSPEYHWRTIEVSAGDYFTGDPEREGGENDQINVPCGVYMRMFYQPNSTKILYQMHSQYWPDRSYGTSMEPASLQAPFHTYFPLNGPPRTDPDAPPTPTSRPVTPTPTPTPDGTPTATPES